MQQKVVSGLYSSTSEVVMDALRAMYEIETRKNFQLANLRHDVQKGIEDAKQGELEEWTSSLSNGIKEIARKRRQS